MTDAAVAVAGTTLTISRLGLGCARIVGGSEASASARLIETALRLGLRHFDTAPSYGLGMSEVVLGDVLAGVAGITITSKIGADVPAIGVMPLKQRVYRRVVRPLLARVPAVKRALQRSPRPHDAAPVVVRTLTSDTAQRSLDRSERLLRRRVNLLLLHEPAQLALDETVPALFAGWQRDGRIAAFGGGTGGNLAAGFAFGSIGQEAFHGSHAVVGRTAILHGVLRDHGGRGSAASRLTQAMSARPDAAFLVSASVPSQLEKLIAGRG